MCITYFLLEGQDYVTQQGVMLSDYNLFKLDISYLSLVGVDYAIKCEEGFHTNSSHFKGQ